MKNYILHHNHKIKEKGLVPDLNKISESIFSLGNGKIGQRGNFEEYYSGPTLRGNYISGVYYPDKTRVGWWKNGYPEYFAKVLNAPDWTGIKITVENQKLDLHTSTISEFKRCLDMKKGIFKKSYTAEFSDGKKIYVKSVRFLSIENDELGAIKYSVKPLNFDGELEVLTDVDADIINQDSNYDEKFWTEIDKGFDPFPFVISETKKTFYRVCTAFRFKIKTKTDGISNILPENISAEKYVGQKYRISVRKDQTTHFIKYAAVCSSMYHPKEILTEAAKNVLNDASKKGFGQLLSEHIDAWKTKWDESDIIIEGDTAAQQGIRFNIFQLNQTYTGRDERLNIGPKGFTGEKYGGSTYWDTEAYCLPFYLSTADSKVAKQLLMYRFKHLDRAIENAQKLGFSGGAALYPMVTMNGEECHNEWEITFEEIHRNGAIARAIFDYIRYTGDKSYLAEAGLEVLIGISRFWAQRISFSKEKQKYVMLGVTGPNEYENNVNNNWYTSTMACWTMEYTVESLKYVKVNAPTRFNEIVSKTSFSDSETQQWTEIVQKMYFPFDENRQIFLQQDGFLDKVLRPASEIPADQRPIHKHWSWDRILRSCFIKQADVLQGFYVFEDRFDADTIRRHFDFYEPMTVHESSLSSCVHSILAAKIGDKERAYQFYLNASRLDLDDYNNDTDDGLHITSMGGTWMTIVYGFAGMRVKNDRLSFNPFIPEQWKSLTFRIRFRENLLLIKIDHEQIQISNLSHVSANVVIFDKPFTILPENTIQTALSKGNL